MHATDFLQRLVMLSRGLGTYVGAPRGAPPVADPETTSWFAAQRRALRARRTAMYTGAGGGGVAVTALAVAAADPGLGIGTGAIALGLLGASGNQLRRARSARPKDDAPPPPLPAPGSPGHRYLLRLDAASHSIDQLLTGADLGSARESAQVRSAVASTAQELRATARRIAAADNALRALGDPRARSAVDAVLSGLTADLHEGVVAVERLVTAAAGVASSGGFNSLGSTSHYLLDEALADLEARGTALQETQRSLRRGLPGHLEG